MRKQVESRRLFGDSDARVQSEEKVTGAATNTAICKIVIFEDRNKMRPGGGRWTGRRTRLRTRVRLGQGGQRRGGRRGRGRAGAEVLGHPCRPLVTTRTVPCLPDSDLRGQLSFACDKGSRPTMTVTRSARPVRAMGLAGHSVTEATRPGFSQAVIDVTCRSWTHVPSIEQVTPGSPAGRTRPWSTINVPNSGPELRVTVALPGWGMGPRGRKPHGG
jgi:hypothetical protein